MNLKPLSISDFDNNMNTNDINTNRNHFILQIDDFDFSPSEITNILNISPTKTLFAGEIYCFNDKDIVSDYNLWQYEEKIISDDFLGDLAVDFIERILDAKKSILITLSNKCRITLVVVQYYYQSHNPGFYLKPSCIKILGEINANIDLDLYCLYKDEE